MFWVEVMLKKALIRLSPVIDVFLLPFAYSAALILLFVRRLGVERLRMSKSALLSVGVFPIRNHYYEPMFDYRGTARKKRLLPGINLNVESQISLANSLTFTNELASILDESSHSLDFTINNRAFGPGDAEYWYQLIRHKKPRRIVEIGSGYSTLMAIKATERNGLEGSDCEHVCIEPFEVPWLEKTGIAVLREKVEDAGFDAFSVLDDGDILFIDSSHMIRPGGDVLFEYLELLPVLKKGVIVHIHDIFTPADYPENWLKGRVRFWNEQYLLEAFLTHNPDWEIIGALNYLHHHHDVLRQIAPSLTPSSEPGSFYIRKTS